MPTHPRKKKKVPPEEKVEYIELFPVKENATKSEKESIRLWNVMVTALRKNGLMKERGE